MAELFKVSRRRFTHLLGAGAMYAVAQRGTSAGSVWTGERPLILTDTPGRVRLNSNENPYGASPRALKAMTDALSLVWRYPDEHVDLLIESIARIDGVNRDQILVGAGSGEILKISAAAFTGPNSDDDRAVELARPTLRKGRGKLIVADPTFEAIINHARVSGAEIVKVPLAKDFSHDLTKMRAAASEGLIFVCNPNNPTASITPKKEMREFIAGVPRQTMIIVDEAYFHYADSPDYESVIPMIKNHPNLIVARTFSKIYGMAGLRCGYCVAQPETIQRLRPHQTWDSVNIMALVAATASLGDGGQVTNGRRLNRETKREVTRELDAIGFQQIPSQANFIMIDVKRPVRSVIDALYQRGIHVGRSFPALPNHLRVTIGKPAEMEKFLSAFRQVAG